MGDEKRTVIDRFSGDFGFLSNFYPATVYVDGLRYPSVEHAYQAAKTSDPKTRELIRNASTSAIAKKLGKSVQLRPDWESTKVDLMRELVRKKFDNPFLAPLLLATGDAELVEGNTWNDTTWGICRGVGQNWLGKILMEVRKELQEAQVNEAESQVKAVE